MKTSGGKEIDSMSRNSIFLTGLCSLVLGASKISLSGDGADELDECSWTGGLDAIFFSRCRALVAFSRLSPCLGLSFLGLPRRSARLTAPTNAPLHIPRCLCLVKASCLAKLLPQSQGYGLTPVWIFACLFRS